MTTKSPTRHILLTVPGMGGSWPLRRVKATLFTNKTPYSPVDSAYHVIRFHIPEDSNFHKHGRKILKRENNILKVDSDFFFHEWTFFKFLMCLFYVYHSANSYTLLIMLYTLFWQHVSTNFVNFQNEKTNLKYILAYTLALDCIKNWCFIP